MKTTAQLESAILVIESAGYGHKKVTILYRGKEYSHVTTNTLATDRLSEHAYISDREVSNSYTYKQALQALYNEVKRANDLY